MNETPGLYHCHRFSRELISHAVWLYYTFGLSFQDVKLLLVERAIVISYDSVRRWRLKFATDFAARLRRRRPRPGETWRIDEVFLRMNGVLHDF